MLYVDSDVEVLGNVAPAFDLPTDFAVVMDPNKEGYSCVSQHPFPTLSFPHHLRRSLLAGALAMSACNALCQAGFLDACCITLPRAGLADRLSKTMWYAHHSSVHTISLRRRYTAMGRGQAGVLFVRPCAAVAAHMLQLASGKRQLQFPYHDAEQDFFDWCVAGAGCC